MRYSEGTLGRVFEALEAMALEAGLERGLCILLGGAADGSEIVAGPREAGASPVEPIVRRLVGVHEVLGVGTLFPDESGRPRLHMHAAFGRSGEAQVGCIRAGIACWKLAEALVLELTGSTTRRVRDRRPASMSWSPEARSRAPTGPSTRGTATVSPSMPSSAACARRRRV